VDADKCLIGFAVSVALNGIGHGSIFAGDNVQSHSLSYEKSTAALGNACDCESTRQL
jgi:hypothetical protein